MSFTRSQESFGSVPGVGGEVIAYTIANSTGISITVLNYGATLLSVTAIDKKGVSEEVTLNYRTLDEVVTNHGPYYGCIAGRVANRIKHGKFSVDGVDYNLAINNGENSLHGGTVGFDQKIWTAVEISSGESCGVELSYTSPDGEEGYPGNLKV
jgi:aldose 1-epimerase